MTEPLILRRIKLDNFLSHRDTLIAFSEGVNTFIGENGAGKSSILEAIHYALTGTGWRTGGKAKKPLIHNNENSASVILEFTYQGHDYKIVRYIRTGHGPMDSIHVDGKPVAIGEENVNNTIRRLLGNIVNQLHMIVLIRQGWLTRILTELKESKRISTIDEILGLRGYEEAGERIKELEITSTKDKTIVIRPHSRLEDRIREIRERIEKEYKDLVRKHMEKREEINKISKEIREGEEKLKEYDEKLGKYGEVEKKYNELREEKARKEELKKATEKRLEEVQTKIEEKKRELEEARRKIEENEPYLKIAGLREAIEELEEIIEKLQDTNKKLGNLQELKKQVREALEEAEKHLSGLAPAEGGMEEEAQEWPEDVDDALNLLEKSVVRIRSDIEHMVKDIRDADEKIADFKERLQSIGLSPKDIENTEELYRAAEELEKILEEKRDRLEEVKEEIGRYKSVIEENKRKIRMLRETAEPRCPLCGQPLTPQHKEEVIGRLEGEIREAEARLRNLEDEAGKLREEIGGIEEKIKVVNPETISALEKVVREKRESKEKLMKVFSELKEISGLLHKLEDKLRDIQSQLTDKATDTAAKIAGELGIPLTMPERLYEKASEKLEKALSIKEEAERLRGVIQQLEKNIESLVEEEGRLSKELASLTGESEKIDEELAVVKPMYEELRRIKEEADKLRGSLESLRRNLAGRERELEEIEKEIDSFKERVEGINEAIRKARILGWLRNNIFHRDGLPRRLRPRILRLMENYMEKLMESFNLGFQDIEIDEKYTVYVHPVDNPSIKRPVDLLSGGEQVSIAMAFLLSLYHIVSREKIGFIALDEPTHNLDGDRRRALVQLLKNFQGGRIIPQLLIVTHDETVKDAADRIFMVRKVNGVSNVTVIEPGVEE